MESKNLVVGKQYVYKNVSPYGHGTLKDGDVVRFVGYDTVQPYVVEIVGGEYSGTRCHLLTAEVLNEK